MGWLRISSRILLKGDSSTSRSGESFFMHNSETVLEATLKKEYLLQYKLPIFVKRLSKLPSSERMTPDNDHGIFGEFLHIVVNTSGVRNNSIFRYDETSGGVCVPCNNVKRSRLE